MSVRVFQGKDTLASAATYTPHRGEIFVNLDTLSLRISDGTTPGGNEIQGGGSGQTMGGSFSLLTGQISEVQIPSHLITNTMLRTDNVATATWILSANSTGGFVWVDPAANGGGIGTVSNVGRTGDYNDLTHIPPFKVVSTSGSFYDLLDYPTVVSAFRNDTGYLTSATLGAYVTTATLNTAVSTAVSNLVGSSGTTFSVIQQLASLLSTSTSTVSLLTNQLGNKLDISTATTYSSPQQAIGRANLGLSTVAATGNYNDLLDKPATFSIAPATQSTIGGVIVGVGLAVDNNGRISLSTTTTILNISSPATLKGQVNQLPGTLQADQNYIYMARTTFNPTGIQTASASSTSTNVIPVAASQWVAAIQNIGSAYQSGQWTIFDTNQTQIYNVTAVSTIGGTAYFTIDTAITYQAAATYYIQTTDTITRIGLEDSYGTAPGGIHGSEPVTVSGTVDMPAGQAYGTTATLLTVDCSGITYGEMAISFVDSTNSEYYKGTCEIFLYPDLTYIVQPNIVGNKTDRITLGFTSGRNSPYQMTNSIKIPVYNSDKNISNNTTNSHASAGTIKYSWLVRTNI